MEGYRIKAECFDAKADKCERLAEKTSFGPAKQDMREVARQCRHLAEHALAKKG
jgi:hypothetical protein